MPNYKVFQDLPSNLRTRLYGMDSGTDIAVVVDASGVLAIQDNGGSITVDATDLDIRDLTNATDSVLIYGNDGTDNQVILTDASGAVAIQDNGGSITVDATDLDIRDLTNATDSVLIYGNDGTNNQVILTDPSGRLLVTLASSFTEATQTVSTVTALVGSTSQDISDVPNYTWFVNNIGATNTADVRLEISPNDLDWVVDGGTETVLTETAIVVVPNVFLRYTRIAYQSTTAGADTSLVLIMQAYN